MTPLFPLQLGDHYHFDNGIASDQCFGSNNLPLYPPKNLSRGRGRLHGQGSDERIETPARNGFRFSGQFTRC
jgi:hypothetical protein